MKSKILTALLFLIVFSSASFVYFKDQKIPCANSKSCVSNFSINNDVSSIFWGETFSPPQLDVAANDSEDQNILGAVEEENAELIDNEKHIYVDLKKQKLYAFEGEELFLETLVSTGKWGRTPPGEYRIWVKMKATLMSGGSGNDYYYLPNVPYTMFFFGSGVDKSRGYALHGTYWHNNFGHEMSHGCVNLRTIDAHTLYDWVSPTTQSNTTYESSDDQGTAISICQEIQFDHNIKPVCLE